MSSRSLPPRPNLAQLKLQARELRRLHSEEKPSAAARIVAHHPKFRQRTFAEILAAPLALADAQTVLAREYGFAGWAQLKHFVELSRRVTQLKPHPRFDEALAAFDAGNLTALRNLLKAEPALVWARGNLEPPYGYFTGATLLHYIAGNPFRFPLPKNIVAIARLLLDFGADANAETIGPNGGTTMGLIITSKHASDAGVSGPLMELLVEHGAKLDLKSSDALDPSLTNHAPRAAEKMIELGAKADIFAAAALGRMDLLRDCFDAVGKLESRPRRNGKALTERDAVGLALLYAYVNQHSETVNFLLEKDGNWNMTGVNNGTALHRAAGDGDLAMVKRLVSKGADINDRHNPYNSTPLSWAEHSKRHDVSEWMRAHCSIDLHDAVGFNLEDHVKARIKEDPQCIHRRLDQWEIPQATAMHCAARQNRERLAKLLLESGCDPNIVAGNGLTALDIAEAKGADGVAKLIQLHGGRRAAELNAATNSSKGN